LIWSLITRGVLGFTVVEYFSYMMIGDRPLQTAWDTTWSPSIGSRDPIVKEYQNKPWESRLGEFEEIWLRAHEPSPNEWLFKLHFLFFKCNFFHNDIEWVIKGSVPCSCYCFHISPLTDQLPKRLRVQSYDRRVRNPTLTATTLGIPMSISGGTTSSHPQRLRLMEIDAGVPLRGPSGPDFVAAIGFPIVWSPWSLCVIQKCPPG
jgi:hypothetical protein